jgi:hypothetical protein
MYTHLTDSPDSLACLSMRMIASSNNTVFPLPVGALGMREQF